MELQKKYRIKSVLEVEYVKTIRGREIGLQSGMFYVPEIVSYDPGMELLEYEFLPGIQTIQNVINTYTHKELSNIFFRIGQSLAIIHQHLILPDNYLKYMPADWIKETGQNVFLHGDFTSDNICYNINTDEIIILDWSTAPLLGGEITYGSRYFDIVWFMRHIFNFSNPADLRYSAEYCNSFLNGYSTASKTNLDLMLYPYYRKTMLKLGLTKIQKEYKRLSVYKKIPHSLKQYISLKLWSYYKPRLGNA